MRKVCWSKSKPQIFVGLRVEKGRQTKRKKEREGKGKGKGKGNEKGKGREKREEREERREERRKGKKRPTNQTPHSAKGSFAIQVHLEFRVYWLSHPLNACSTAPVKLLKG